MSGTDGAFHAAAVVGGELSRAGVEEATVLRLVEEMPFAAGSTPPGKVRRQMRGSARRAFAERWGSGCPGRGSENVLVDTFGGYCDAACRKTCRIVRAGVFSRRAVDETPYRAVYRSALWQSKGLGLVGRDVYAELALLSFAAGGEPVRASARFLSKRLGFIHARPVIQRALATMAEIGLVEVVDARRGERRVVEVDDDAVRLVELLVGVDVGAGRSAVYAGDVAAELPEKYRRALEWRELWSARGAGLLAADVYAALAALQPSGGSRKMAESSEGDTGARWRRVGA